MKYFGIETIRDPKSFEWKISREWIPGAKRLNIPARFKWWKGKEKNLEPMGDVIVGFDLEGLIVGLLIFGILIFFFIPVLLIFIDLAFLLLIFLIALLTKIVLRQPWKILAECENGQVIERKVVGWFASRQEIKRLMDEISTGSF